jgi:aromatic ring-opening dioxygenase LigB subunit
MLKVFKINFYKSTGELEDLYDYFSELDKEKLNDLDTESYFDYDDLDGNYTLLIIASHIEVDKYIKIIRDNNLKVDYLDISNDILKSKYDLESDLFYLINEENEIKFDFFIHDLNNWILENLDIDYVLDRISEVGINNLSKIEKEFLENYKI